MKKVLALVLTIALLVTASVSVFAAESPTAHNPEKISSKCDGCSFVLWGQRFDLPEAKKAAFEAAKEALSEAVPEGYACRSIVYFDVEDDCAGCDVAMVMDGTQVADAEMDVEWTKTTGKDVCCAYSVDMVMGESVIVMQYVDGEWAEGEVEVEGNVVTVKGMVDGPAAIFMK